jgi:hypothetical protein
MLQLASPDLRFKWGTGGATRENGIQNDLQRTDHRAAQLWFLAIGFLILCGGIMFAGFTLIMSEMSPHPSGPAAMFYRATVGWLFSSASSASTWPRPDP